MAKNGSDWPTHRRRRSRFQQSAPRYYRQPRPARQEGQRSTRRGAPSCASAKGSRARGSIHQLLAFATRQTLRPESRPINDLVREFDVLTSRVLGKSVWINFGEPDPSAGACDVDPAQFGSTRLNLVVNARDAMSSGGELRIRTASHSLSAQDAARYPDARTLATMSSCRSRIVASVCRRRSSSGR